MAGYGKRIKFLKKFASSAMQEAEEDIAPHTAELEKTEACRRGLKDRGAEGDCPPGWNEGPSQVCDQVAGLADQGNQDVGKMEKVGYHPSGCAYNEDIVRVWGKKICELWE